MYLVICTRVHCTLSLQIRPLLVFASLNVCMLCLRPPLHSVCPLFLVSGFEMNLESAQITEREQQLLWR